MHKMSSYNDKGFTLLETLIVVAIFAIGAAIAIPAIMQMGKRDEVKSAARHIKDEMARAKISAIEDNAPVTVTVNADNYTVGGRTIAPDNTSFSITDEDGNSLKDAGGNDTNSFVWNTRGRTANLDGPTTIHINVSAAGVNRTFTLVISPVGGLHLN